MKTLTMTTRANTTYQKPVPRVYLPNTLHKRLFSTVPSPSDTQKQLKSTKPSKDRTSSNWLDQPPPVLTPPQSIFQVSFKNGVKVSLKKGYIEAEKADTLVNSCADADIFGENDWTIYSLQ